MKRFLGHTFLFLVFTTCFYIVALAAWGAMVPKNWKKNLNYRRGASGFTYTRLQEVHNTTKVDILFAGSSHAYRGFDPRIFKQAGYTSFNLGSSSQTPLQTGLLIDRYLEQLSPSVVVFEVYPYTFSSDGVESSLDIIANDNIDAGSVDMALKINNIKTYNTLVYGFTKRAIVKENPLKELLSVTGTEGKMTAYSSYIKGGFMEKRLKSNDLNDSLAHNLVIHPATEKQMRADAAIVQNKEGKWAPRDYQLKAFEKILNRLKQGNTRVVLVQAPVNSSYYAMIKCHDEIDAYFSSKGEYYNFNEIIKFDDGYDFADYHHLNQHGVKKMNEVLLMKAFAPSRIQPVTTTDIENK